MIYLIKSEIEEKQTGIIQEAIEIGEKFVVANKISLHISPQVILASIKVAEKTKSSLLFAHTHPSSELFPKEFQVFKDKMCIRDSIYGRLIFRCLELFPDLTLSKNVLETCLLIFMRWKRDCLLIRR